MNSTRKFGFECEVSSGGRQLAKALYDLGEAPRDHLCDYHCSCLAHERTRYAFHPQEDCSCSGEMVSWAIPFGDDSLRERTFGSLERAFAMSGAAPGQSSGCHVHVDRRDLDIEHERNLLHLFGRYNPDLQVLAYGRMRRNRGYNLPLRTKPSRGDGGSFDFWANDWYAPYDQHTEYHYEQYRWMDYSYGWPQKGADLARRASTYEFRLWNATRAAWRWHMFAGVSVAMVDAAKAGVNATEDDPEPFLCKLAPFMDDATLAYVLRQLEAKS